MPRDRIVVTDSFRRLKIESDDIPTSMIQEGGDFFHFNIDLGDGDWAMLIVPAKTVDKRIEYFKQI